MSESSHILLNPNLTLIPFPFLRSLAIAIKGGDRLLHGLANRANQTFCKAWERFVLEVLLYDCDLLSFFPAFPANADEDTAMRRNEVYVLFMFCFLFKSHVTWRKFCADYTQKNGYANAKQWPPLRTIFAHGRKLAEWLQDETISLPNAQLQYCAVEFQSKIEWAAGQPAVSTVLRGWSPEAHWDRVATTQAVRDMVKLLLTIQSKYELEFEKNETVNALCLSTDLWVGCILPCIFEDSVEYFFRLSWFVQ